MATFTQPSMMWPILLATSLLLQTPPLVLSNRERECIQSIQQYWQSVQLADSGDGFTEMIPPKPHTLSIWPGENKTLYHNFQLKTSPNKVWLFQTMKGVSHRLDKSSECFRIGQSERRDPYQLTFYLNTEVSGLYMLAEFDTNWKLLKKMKNRLGRNEIYTPLITYLVLALKPATIGLTLRFASYEQNAGCDNAVSRAIWVVRSLSNMRAAASERKENALLDGTIEYEIRREVCRVLSNDSSPTYVVAYYNIDRARITPNGLLLDRERAWAERGERLTALRSLDRIVIPVPQPFGSVTRIKLFDVFVWHTDELNISLISRSLEAMNEPFWGVKAGTPPFPKDQAVPYVFASVRINQTLFSIMGANSEHQIPWMTIEPAYGRIRTANGVMVAMNVWDSWVNAQFLVEVHIEKNGYSRELIRVGAVAFEQPQHPEDIGEALRVIHNQRSLHGVTPKFGRACLTIAHGYATSSYHLSLENRTNCIVKDKQKYGVWKSTASVRSSLIPYTIQLLYDDFGDELINATGTVVGQIQVATFPRTSRKLVGDRLDLYCPPRTSEDGETFRVGFLVDRKNDSTQYLARWEDRWVRFMAHTAELKHYMLKPMEETPWVSTKNICPPERMTLDFVYDLDTQTLRAMANDTDELLLNVTLAKHPLWMGFEIFAEDKGELCVQCFVDIQIDRRGVHYHRPIRWPVVDSAVNEWHQIHVPRQRNAKSQWNGWIDVSQHMEQRAAQTASPKNLQRRLLEYARRLANPIGLSIAMVGAGSYCPPGQYMPYGTPAVCVECPPGTYSRILYPNTSFPVRVCDQCMRGTYQEIPGNDTCSACAPGQTTQKRGSWSRGACGPNITLRMSKTRGIPELGEPYVMIEFSGESKQQVYDWTPEGWNQAENILMPGGLEGPGELNMVGMSRLVFNMISLVLLLACIMTFVITSGGYMLVWISHRSRVQRPSSLKESPQPMMDDDMTVRNEKRNKTIWPPDNPSSEAASNDLDRRH